jgi:excisionase family DNA binding protein
VRTAIRAPKRQGNQQLISTAPAQTYPLTANSGLSAADAAAFLRVSTKTVRRLLARGELGASRVGRQLRINRSELLAYLRRQLLET